MSRRPERGGRPAWESEADIMMEKTEQGLGRLCVIGDPVEHSKSPLIQNAMIAKLGIPYHYTKRLVHQGDTQEWLDTARPGEGGGVCGLQRHHAPQGGPGPTDG